MLTTSTNNWVSYLDRTYEQIKRSLLNRLVVNNPEISDHNESNIFIIIISMFAGIAEMLNYYIDNMAREAFITSARKYESVIRHATLIDYETKAAVAATVDLKFTLKDINGNTVNADQDVSIPIGTRVSNQNGIEFVTLEDAVIGSGTNSVFVPAENSYNAINISLGTTAGSANESYFLPTTYFHNTLGIEINGEAWALYHSFARMFSDTKGFIVRISEDGLPYLLFGDGINGAIPVAGYDVTATFRTTNGVDGNLPYDSINQLLIPIDVPVDGQQVVVNNNDYSSGGSAIESIDEIRTLAPKSLRTLNRAVTYQDYKDIANLVPGVGTSEVRFCCGKYVDVFIIPKSKGNASQYLRNKTFDEFQDKKMITTQVAIFAAGISRIWIQATIYGKPLYTAEAIQIDLANALDAEYGFKSAVINEKLSISDIIATIEALPKVDSVEIARVGIEPYVRIEVGERPLDYVFNSIPRSSDRYPYNIKWNDTDNKFEIYRNNLKVGSVLSDEAFADEYISITMTNNVGYQIGDTWSFEVQPSYPETFPVSKIEVKDYSAPIIDVGDEVSPDIARTIFSDFTIIPQGVMANKKPTC